MIVDFGGLDAGWQPVVEAWRASPAGQGLLAHLAQREAAGATIYPPSPCAPCG